MQLLHQSLWYTDSVEVAYHHHLIRVSSLCMAVKIIHNQPRGSISLSGKLTWDLGLSLFVGLVAWQSMGQTSH